MTFEHQETSMPPEMTEGEQVSHSEADLSPEGIQSMQGPPVLSTEVLSQIAEVNNLPVEQRREAWGSFVASLSSAEVKKLGEITTIERNGEGVTLEDYDGQVYTISYSDEE